MKQPLLLFTLFCLFSLGSIHSSGQLSPFAPDNAAISALKKQYDSYVDELYHKIIDGELPVYMDPSLTRLLQVPDRRTYFTQAAEIENFDPLTDEFTLVPITDTLIGDRWDGIRFELNYVTIRINEDKILFLPNAEKSKLNGLQTQLLEKTQSEAHLAWLNHVTLEEKGHLIYDLVQIRIFDAVKEGRVPCYYPDSLHLTMSLAHFDTAYDYFDYVWIDGWDDPVESMRIDFSGEQINGTCLRMEMLETSDGWHLETTHYGITYTRNDDLPYRIACWIKHDDLKQLLSKDDWLLLQEIWRLTLSDKLD